MIPIPMPMMPVAANDGIDLSAVLAELRALRAETKAQAEMIARLTKQAGDQAAKAASATTDAVEQGNDDRRKGQRQVTVAGRGKQATAA